MTVNRSYNSANLFKMAVSVNIGEGWFYINAFLQKPG